MDNSQPRQRRASGGPARHAQYPSYPQYPSYDGAGTPPPAENVPPASSAPYADYTAYGGGRRSRQRMGRGRSRNGLWLLVLIVCIGLLVLGGFIVSSLYSGHYPAFRSNVEALAGGTFLYGVHVDDIHLGGLTMEEARSLLTGTTVAQDQRYSLSVTVDGKTWRITQSERPLERNTESVLQEAFSIGRQTEPSAVRSGMTPFEYRSQLRQEISRDGAFLYTQVTYDKATVRALADKLSSRVSNPAKDATVSSFDFATRSFQYQKEQSGTFLGSDEIYEAITAQMDARNYNGAITLSTHPQQPTVTQAQLQQNFGLIASYSTDTLASFNRNKNIELACKALNGTVLESGKTLSFNEITGRRTVDKGYLMAPAIAQGRSYEEAGGGVCQVSSTLFNAAAMANMKIVTSTPHAWPSAYVDPGRDATVDWQSGQKLEDSLDLKIRNTSPYPIFIVSYITGSNYHRVCLCTVEIYGVSLNDGIRIQLEAVLSEEPIPSPTPKPPERAPLDELHPSPTQEIIVKGREGLKYKTYRVFYQDGVEIKRELLRTSYYKPYAEQVRIYE